MSDDTTDNSVLVTPWENMDRVTERLLRARLDHYEGDKQKVANSFGVSLKTIYNWIKRYEL